MISEAPPTLTRQLEESVMIAKATKSADNPVGIRQKMLAIMREVAYIQKDKRNEFHKYSYASEAAIKTDLHASLVRYGVLFHNSILEVTERSASNGKDTITTINVGYWFECADTGEKTEQKFIYGSGSDPADKGIYKAITGALKYALTGQFLIATGDDPEGEEKVSKADAKAAQKAVADRKLAEIVARGATVRDVGRPQALITGDQLKRLHTIASNNKVDRETSKLIMASYGFTSSKDITVDKYDGICGDIERCGKVHEVIPPFINYNPGQHVNVNGVVHRLGEENCWEPLGDLGIASAEKPKRKAAKVYDELPDPMIVSESQIYLGNVLYQKNADQSAWTKVL